LRERFRREAKAAANLNHPNIVSVFEIDDVSPICWIAYAYCPGMTLSEWISKPRSPVSAHDAANLVATLADALQHAHNRGILHRDLKPGNVLLENRGLRTEDGRLNAEQNAGRSTVLCPLSSVVPKIADFGLAKFAEQPTDMTRSGVLVGTPAYMAPEQARGKPGTGDSRSDVYALGVMLYELLVGRPPISGDTDVETLQLVQTIEPVRPRQLRPNLPRDLETVTLKCLEKDASRRYESAADLRDDLRRFIAGEPVLARPVSQVARIGRWCRRRPAIAGLSVALVLTIVGGIAGMAVAYARIKQERNAAITATEKSERETERANRERDAAVAANEKSERETQRANSLRNAAVAANQKSERLLASSGTALQEMINLGHGLTHTPQTVDHGTSILKSAHKYYGKLIEEDPHNEDLRDKAAVICRRLALIYKEKQSFTECEQMWIEAVEHYQRRIATAPNEPMRRWDLHFSMSGLGYAKEMLGKTEDAELLRTQSDEIAEGLLAEFPEQPAYQDAVARACYNRGEKLRQQKRYAEAEPEFTRSVELDRKFTAQAKGYEHAHRLIFTMNRLADCQVQLRRYDEAEVNARESVKLCEALAARFPDQPPDVQKGMSLFLLRQVYGAKQQWLDALAVNRDCLAIVTRLKDKPHHDTDFYVQFLRQSIRITECFDKLGQKQEALPYLLAAVQTEVPDFSKNKLPPEILTCCDLVLCLQSPRDPTIIEKAKRLLLDSESDPKCAKAHAKLTATLQQPSP
jgi:tetratricopeptide (TPR) repeat protein/tRNA A-37 threonylcarbamoyl transferase component Bud32